MDFGSFLRKRNQHAPPEDEGNHPFQGPFYNSDEVRPWNSWSENIEQPEGINNSSAPLRSGQHGGSGGPHWQREGINNEGNFHHHHNPKNPLPRQPEDCYSEEKDFDFDSFSNEPSYSYDEPPQWGEQRGMNRPLAYKGEKDVQNRGNEWTSNAQPLRGMNDVDISHKGSADQCATDPQSFSGHVEIQPGKTAVLKSNQVKGGPSKTLGSEEQDQGKESVGSSAKPKNSKKEGPVKSEAEMQKLAEFDIVTSSVNWAHFNVTKSMLLEAGSEGKEGISAKRNFDVTKLEFYCKLCDVQTVSAGNLQAHLNGKKHKFKAEQEVHISVSTEEKDNSEQDKIDDSVSGEPLCEASDFGANLNALYAKEEGEKDKSEDKEYQAQYYANFKMEEVSFDWEALGITREMLKEASTECGVKTFEHRSFDIFKLQFYCKLCDLQSTGGYNFYQHLISRKHKNKTLKHSKMIKGLFDDNGNVDEEKKNLTEAEERNIFESFDILKVDLKWEQFDISKSRLMEASMEGIFGISTWKMRKKEYDVTKLEFYCKLCATQMGSVFNFADHLRGKRHKHAFEEHVKFLMANKYSEDHLPIEKSELGQKSIVDVCLKSTPKRGVVGLGELTELHSIYNVWISCNLCGCKFPGCSSLKHVFGYKHRLLYVRKYHPEDYAELKRMYADGNSHFQRLNEICVKVEAKDGKGEPKIKRYEKELEEEKDLTQKSVPIDDNPEHISFYRRLHLFLKWIGKESEIDIHKFSEEVQQRPLSPILSALKQIREHGDRSQEYPERPDDRSFDDHNFEHGHRLPPSRMHPPPMRERMLYDDRHLPWMERERMHYDERDIPPHIRKRRMHLDRHLPPPPYHERDYDFALKERFRDRDIERNREPSLPRLHRDIERNREPSLPRLHDPHFENRSYREQLSVSRELPSRIPLQDPYLDPNPLNRVLKSQRSEPYIDPDPLKRVLPSQKAKQARPVVIDYGHGKEEKSEESKAKEWEDDINDILKSSESKGTDSLALLNSSYASPKREKSPKRRKSPKPKPAKELPFSKSYLDRAKEIRSRNRSPKRDSWQRSPKKDYGQRSPTRDSGPRSPKRDYGQRSRDYGQGGPKRDYGQGGPKRDYGQKSPTRDSGPRSPKRDYGQKSQDYGQGGPKRDYGQKSPTRDYGQKSQDYGQGGPKRDYGQKSPTRDYGQKSPTRDYGQRSRDYGQGGPKKDSGQRSPNRDSGQRSPKRDLWHRSPKRDPGCYAKRRLSKSPEVNRYEKYSRNSPPAKKSNDSLYRSLPIPPPKSRQISRDARDPFRRSKSPGGWQRPISISPESSPRQITSLGPQSQRSKSPVDFHQRFQGAEGSKRPSSPPRGPPPKRPDMREILTPKSIPVPSNAPAKPRKPVEEPRSSKAKNAGQDEEEAQAEKIANMLLNMKSSIVGGEIDDPHAALQALLSSKDIAETLFALQSEKKGKSQKEDASLTSKSELSRQSASSANKQSREKIAFSFSGKSSGPAKNIPRTFVDESDEEQYS